MRVIVIADRGLRYESNLSASRKKGENTSVALRETLPFFK